MIHSLSAVRNQEGWGRFQDRVFPVSPEPRKPDRQRCQLSFPVPQTKRERNRESDAAGSSGNRSTGIFRDHRPRWSAIGNRYDRGHSFDRHHIQGSASESCRGLTDWNRSAAIRGVNYLVRFDHRVSIRKGAHQISEPEPKQHGPTMTM
jgi:hypothetical protein